MDLGKKLRDIEFGLKSEEVELPNLKLIFGSNLVKTSNQYALFDFEGDNLYVELKTRRESFNKYSYQKLIGKNKIDEALRLWNENQTKCYFLFKYDEGTWYWLFNKDQYDNGEVQIKYLGRTDRGIDERKDECVIHPSLLKPLSTLVL